MWPCSVTWSTGHGIRFEKCPIPVDGIYLRIFWNVLSYEIRLWRAELNCSFLLWLITEAHLPAKKHQCKGSGQHMVPFLRTRGPAQECLKEELREGRVFPEPNTPHTDGNAGGLLPEVGSILASAHGLRVEASVSILETSSDLNLLWT